jgi:hypothetical protein
MTQHEEFLAERIRMRIAGVRALLVLMVLLKAMTAAHGQQPLSIDVQTPAWSQQRTQIYGGLNTSLEAFSVGVGPASVSGGLQVDPVFVSGGLQVEPAPSSSAVPQASTPQTTHRFWDRTNDLLFAAVGAGRALDYASTLNLRRRGDDEIFLTNAIVDNHPLFGGIEAAATAASIGVSYIFHRTGHHQLERWTSIVHFGVATGGAARNYALKTAHHP